MSTIASFKAQMAGGGARPNQFRVGLTFPRAIQNGLTQTAGQAAPYLCRAASLPASTVQDIVVGFRGRPVHFAGEREFPAWTISVLNDNNFLIRDAFEYWSNAIVNYDRTNGLLRPADYTADMVVTQLDRDDRAIKSYIFRDAFPTTVGEIQLSFDQNNQIEEFPVQFVYNWFEPTNVPL
jgi:hypothetical protein